MSSSVTIYQDFGGEGPGNAQESFRGPGVPERVQAQRQQADAEQEDGFCRIARLHMIDFEQTYAKARCSRVSV
jgi:hypothetical protein